MICVQSACGAEDFSLSSVCSFRPSVFFRVFVSSTEFCFVNQPGIALVVAGSAARAALRDATRPAPGSHRPR